MPQALGRRRPHRRFNQGGGDGILSAMAWFQQLRFNFRFARYPEQVSFAL
jgi:hypothetical protein